MEKLLIVGVDTIVGANVALALSDRLEVFGIGLRQEVRFDSLRSERSTADEVQRLAAACDEFCPDWIVHCGSLSASSWDLPAHDPAWEQEPQLVSALVESARRHEARLTVVTTDAVFSGPRMFHEEDSPTSTVHSAAMYALRLEQGLSDTGALVVRTHAYGWAPIGSEPGLIEKIWESLDAGASFAADGCRYATPILATDLAECLYRARDLQLQGLVHLTGAERTNSFRLAGEMAAAFGIQFPRNCLVRDTSTEKLASAETSLSSRRARRALELPMPTLREGLARFAEQLANGWRHRSRSGERGTLVHGFAA